MKLPPIYIIFEQIGNQKPMIRDIEATKKQAKEACRINDHIPKSGGWFFKKYIPEQEKN